MARSIGRPSPGRLVVKEPPMPPLDSHDLLINIIVVVMMPLIIWANLRKAGLKYPLNAYLWRENPNLMRLSLVYLSLLTMYSAMELAGHFGFASAAAVDQAGFIVGLPMLALSVLILVLAVRAGWKAQRGGKDEASKA
jgi:hypothetical protein